MQGESISGGQAARLASASMDDNAATATAPSSSGQTRIDAEGGSSKCDGRAKERVGK